MELTGGDRPPIRRPDNSDKQGSSPPTETRLARCTSPEPLVNLDACPFPQQRCLGSIFYHLPGLPNTEQFLVLDDYEALVKAISSRGQSPTPVEPAQSLSTIQRNKIELLSLKRVKSMDGNKERELLQQAQRGDKKAIAGLYDLHYRSVYNYLHYRVSDPQIAEDLSAEVFIRMLRKLPAYTDRGRPILAWLYTIARNILIDHHRSLGKVEEVSLKEELLEDRIKNPDQQVQDRQTSDCFRKALRHLPDSQRQLLIYRFINGFSTPKIIRLLNRSDRAVRSLQHRALRSLEKVLVEENCL